MKKDVSGKNFQVLTAIALFIGALIFSGCGASDGGSAEDAGTDSGTTDTGTGAATDGVDWSQFQHGSDTGTTTDDTDPDGDTEIVDGDDTGEAVDGDTEDETAAETDAEAAPQCDENGFRILKPIAHMVQDLPAGQYEYRFWGYSSQRIIPGHSLTFDYKLSGGPVPAPVEIPIDETEAGAECKLCLKIQKDCSYTSSGDINCAFTYLPEVGGTLSITEIGAEVQTNFSGALHGVRFRQATQIGGQWVPLAAGKVICIPDMTFTTKLGAPGYVDMQPPADLPQGCTYPEGPYFFMGPEPGNVTPAQGTIPPFGWPGAYSWVPNPPVDGDLDDAEAEETSDPPADGDLEAEETAETSDPPTDGDLETAEIPTLGLEAGQWVRTGFNIAKYRCEHPEITTLFIFNGAGWCTACAAFYGDTFCGETNAQGKTLEQQLMDLGSAFVYVEMDTNTPGEPADDEFARDKMSHYGCVSGFRTADRDNTSHARSVAFNDMSRYLPWVAAVRMSDMKLLVQVAGAGIDYIGIATANRDAANPAKK